MRANCPALQPQRTGSREGAEPWPGMGALGQRQHSHGGSGGGRTAGGSWGPGMAGGLRAHQAPQQL